MKIEVEEFEKYNTKKFYLLDVGYKLDERFSVVECRNTNYGYQKRNVLVLDDNVKEQIEKDEKEINNFFKKYKVPGVKLINGSRIYCKIDKGDNKKDCVWLKFVSIYVNDENKPFLSAYLTTN